MWQPAIPHSSVQPKARSIYIFIHRYTVSLYHNCSMWLLIIVFETQFLPDSGRIDTAYMDALLGRWEKARRQLLKNAASNIEQVLAATPHKAPTIQPPASHHENYPRHAGHCWRSRDELISDVLLWTLTYGLEKAGRPARTYIQQLCEDTRCSPEDLPEAMNDREKWRERVRDIRACGTIWWWWWILIICLHSVKWFQVFLWNTNKSI